MKRWEKLMQWYRMLIGIFMSNTHQLQPEVKKKLNQIVEELFESAKKKPKGKTFIMIVGFSQSGKRWLINRHPVLNRLFCVHTDPIHDLLNNRFKFLRDDNTVEGKAYWERQFLTNIIKEKLLAKAFPEGLAVLNDSCNLKKEERKERLALAKRFSYKTIIIWMVCSEATLLSRLKKADIKNVNEGEKPAWVELYQKVQKVRFNPPNKNEADEILIFDSEKNSPEKVIIKI